MSLITASVVRALRTWEGDLDEKARKLLAFVDNRQDASLQAGHFNDFVQVTQLRGALYRALAQAPDGLTDEIVAQRVTEELGLDMADFAQQPRREVQPAGRGWRALREVTGYRLYLDLERGWRVTMPNLEQTGLLAHPLPGPSGDRRRRRGVAALPRRAARRRTGAPARRSPRPCWTSCAATWPSRSSTSARTGSTRSGGCPRST